MGMPNVTNNNLRMVAYGGSNLDTTDQGNSYLDSYKVKFAALLGKYLNLKVTNDTLYILEEEVRRLYGAAY